MQYMSGALKTTFIMGEVVAVQNDKSQIPSNRTTNRDCLESRIIGSEMKTLKVRLNICIWFSLKGKLCVFYDALSGRLVELYSNLYCLRTLLYGRHLDRDMDQVTNAEDFLFQW